MPIAVRLHRWWSDRQVSGVLAGFAPLLRGLSAFGGAELITRLVRLGITIIIARRLAPDIIGEAALALTVFELVKVLEKTGTGARIIAAHDDELAVTCNTANRIYAWWTGALTLAQIALGAALALVWAKPAAGMMLVALSGVYPVMAIGHVAFHLALRQGRNGRLARIAATQNIADQVLTTALLLLWPSPWSIVLPKLLTAPLWLVMVRRTVQWRPDPTAGLLPLGRIVGFSASILAAEALQAVRTQGDNLIVAAVLGTHALGLYYFAFNAGLGILSSAVSALGMVAFPQLCRAAPGHERVAALRRTIVLALMVGPLAAVQSLAAPWYVPLIFGRTWTAAAPLVSVLCLAAIPLAAASLTTCWLRAHHRAGIDALASALMCAAALGGLWLGAHLNGLMGAARGLVLGQTVATALVVGRLMLPDLRGLHRPLKEEQIA